MKVSTFKPCVSPVGRALFLGAAACFTGSALVGWIASLHYLDPIGANPWLAPLRMDVLRPLHLLLATSGMLSGAMAITQSLLNSLSKEDSQGSFLGGHKVAAGSLALFTLLAALFIGKGMASGREYIAWPAWTSPLLGLALGATLWSGARSFRRLSGLSPEGAVLLGIGWTLIAAGFLECHSHLIGWIFANEVRDLTARWHGIDTFVAGINVALYAGMIFLLQSEAKPLRAKVLFSVATFGLLGTFGHHHYVSPQPAGLKIFAFLASMVAVVSFVRHVRGFGKSLGSAKRKEPVFALLLSAEAWTLVAVASGVLFAIPQINFYVHGTYLIIIHAMGSMIGINFIITVAAGLVFCGARLAPAEGLLRWGGRLVNGALVLLWGGLAIPAVMKGVMRGHQTFQEYMPAVAPWLMVFPLAGLVLLAGIGLLSWELATASVSVVEEQRSAAGIPSPRRPLSATGTPEKSGSVSASGSAAGF